ncbi:succinylglutamate desuccinylase/aspartoacylase family protein, partial [Alishewanella sp. SMS9]|nr:succinylglutamate desuccinylase/aspartoacylase family protein [Alishewanella sp. SMS9]
QYVTRFYEGAPANEPRCLYDLHTAIRGSRFEKFAVYPFLHGKPWRKQQLQFLAACDVHTVLMMQTPASTFSYYASHSHGADAFTIE